MGYLISALRHKRIIHVTLAGFLLACAPAIAAGAICPPGSILEKEIQAGNKIVTHCKCLPGRILINKECIVEQSPKDPACVKKCGLELKTDLQACRAHAADCLNNCGLVFAVAECAADCLTSGNPACLAKCGIAASKVAVCKVEGMTCEANAQNCYGPILNEDRFCRATCPDQ